MPDEVVDGQGVADAQAASQGEPEPLTFEKYYSGLDETTRGLLDGHVSGLKSALQSERKQRDDLAKQIRDLVGKAEKGSEFEKQLADVSAKLETAERRATFLEDASKPEIGCTNPRLAFVLAQAESLWDRHGAADWDALRVAAPELFRKPGPGSADGGAGNGKQRPMLDMNTMIRRAAGRG